jgi:2-keto-4-pentenoate hydratase/2-oxohepta-3-ene-1,7-dioic acid hydratase in catechol pathway
MKARIVRYSQADSPHWGVVDGETVYTLDGDPFGRWKAGAAVGALTSLTLLVPVVPTKILCVGRNYPAHAAEHAVEVPAEPLLFLKPPSALVGPGAPVVLPPQSQQVEYEAELALVIGRRGRNIDPATAWRYVVGVTCANDVTARDLQRQDRTWTRGKGFDTFCPAGPWVVTGLSEEDIADLSVVCRVNGVVRQRGRTSEMVFSPSALVAYASTIMTLEPGDLLLTGTPAGVGPLHPGDRVEVEIETIGTLHNPVQ